MSQREELPKNMFKPMNFPLVVSQPQLLGGSLSKRLMRKVAYDWEEVPHP